MHRNINAEGFLCFESKLAAPHGHRGQAGGQRATIHSRVGTKQPPSPQTPPPAQAQPQTQQHKTARPEGSEAWDQGTLFDREFLLKLSLSQDTARMRLEAGEMVEKCSCGVAFV